MAIKGARGEKERIAPHLIVRNAAEAVEFYKRALGARDCTARRCLAAWECTSTFKSANHS